MKQQSSKRRSAWLLLSSSSHRPFVFPFVFSLCDDSAVIGRVPFSVATMTGRQKEVDPYSFLSLMTGRLYSYVM